MNFIKDPLLGDYCVQIDEYNYTAIRTITPESGIKYDHTIGHYDTLGRALKKGSEGFLWAAGYSRSKDGDVCACQCGSHILALMQL